jgi:hypothetical protein
MIKTAHEAPKAIFPEVQKLTDIDYALVHLFEEDEEYFNKFKKAVEDGREVILDNSIFELGEAFDAERYAYWIEKLKPTWYIVPDALENRNKTMKQMELWNAKYKDSLPGKRIGVVQGKTYAQLLSCYKYMNESADVDMIAISFDYSFYERVMPYPNKYVAWALGRVSLLARFMNEEGLLNKDKPHHLLGCGVPQEFEYYRRAGYDWIYSVDTSNPVVHGIKDIRYTDQGLWDKESQKLFTMINSEVSEEQMEVIRYNIEKFRWFCNGAE